MISFKNFMQILQEMKGDFGSGIMPLKPKCGWDGTTTYKMLPGKRVCKFKRKR